jgi:putative DNA primase/helicase
VEAKRVNNLVDAIVAVGFNPPPTIEWDGKVHRFATDQKRRHRKDGWYVAFHDATGHAAAFGSWRDSSKHTWSNGTGRKITSDEWAKIEAAKREEHKRIKAEKINAATRAKRIYDAASEQGQSLYIKSKGIGTPAGVRYVENLDARAFGFDSQDWSITGIIVPMIDPKGVLVNLQVIPDGSKKYFMPSARMDGCFHVIGGAAAKAEQVIIAEGMATAQSIHETTGSVTVVAFTAHNLMSVAMAIRARNALANIIIAADGDEAGRRGAEQAASKVNGTIVFAPDGKDFNDVPFPKDEPPPGIKKSDTPKQNSLWKADLIVKELSDGTQKIVCRAHNLIKILTHADEFSGRISFDEFAGSPAIDAESLSDASLVRMKAELERHWIQDKVSTGDVSEAITVVAEMNNYHPVRDFLTSIKWDGKPRVDSFFINVCDSPDTPYYRMTARYLFLAAAARIFEPGIKADMMPVLEGNQGWGKSTMWSIIAGDDWYSDVTSNINDKDFFSGLRGIWFADLGELDQFNKAETSRIKQVISLTVDHYRPHYGRAHCKFPRQNIFVGGTNRDDWIKDPTGGRRFLPIRMVKPIDLDYVRKNRNMLWAEAASRFTVEDWWNVPDAAEYQEKYYHADSWEDVIADWLVGKSIATTTDILSSCMNIEVGKHMRGDQIRVGNIMIRLRWVRKRVKTNGKVKWVYQRE